MSKKKASGSTMTLKDFHGGSIPSDLPLPSAPGVTVRPVDRSGYERQSSWGSTMGRPDYRSRPHSSPSTRTFDDKTPFLAPAHMGRNFDEDERKPLDGVSAPRRIVSDDALQLPAVRGAELSPHTARLSGQMGLAPVSPLPSSTMASYSSRVSEKGNVGMGMNSHNVGSNSGSYPNAWNARKEADSITEQGQFAWSELAAESKLAHASALEKVSSGRWQTKLSAHQQPDVEAIRYPEMESGPHSKGNNSYTNSRISGMREKDSHNAVFTRNVERGIHHEKVQKSDRDLLIDEKTSPPLHIEAKERNPTIYNDGVQLSRSDGKFASVELQRPLSSEASERPRLKLLPRSRPVENSETHAVHNKQGYQKQVDGGHTEHTVETYDNVIPSKPGSGGSDSGTVAVDRPKLNLKPRSQPPQQLQGTIERERNTLFGGALPRELVLRERGINDISDNLEPIKSPNRLKHDVPKIETAYTHVPSRHGEKAENLPSDHRTGKNIDRRDHRVDVERADTQRRNWRNDNRRNNRDTEKQQQERPPSPETWRRESPDSPDAPGVRYGKAASAVELAQAFSRSMSDTKTAKQFASPRDVTSRTQIPFSRLTASNPRPQINGY